MVVLVVPQTFNKELQQGWVIVAKDLSRLKSLLVQISVQLSGLSHISNIETPITKFPHISLYLVLELQVRVVPH